MVQLLLFCLLLFLFCFILFSIFLSNIKVFFPKSIFTGTILFFSVFLTYFHLLYQNYLFKTVPDLFYCFDFKRCLCKQKQRNFLYMYLRFRSTEDSPSRPRRLGPAWARKASRRTITSLHNSPIVD